MSAIETKIVTVANTPDNTVIIPNKKFPDKPSLIKDKFFDKLDIGIRGQKGNFIRWHLDKKVTLFGQKGNY